MLIPLTLTTVWSVQLVSSAKMATGLSETVLKGRIRLLGKKNALSVRLAQNARLLRRVQ